MDRERLTRKFNRKMNEKEKTGMSVKEMKEMFENAKFGDAFKTKDGKKVLYLNYYPSYYRDTPKYVKVYIFIEENCIDIDEYDNFIGIRYSCSFDERYPDGCPIIGKWEE